MEVVASCPRIVQIGNELLDYSVSNNIKYQGKIENEKDADRDREKLKLNLLI